ncbi:Peptidase M15 [Paracoccus alcaliphilus]|uniref:Murein endopeptidase K n=1 Tax=Paracoccus alcaliphilus TaxID=34002 RepID=A0A1H8MES3_9RHOB|nr:D-Ala-D-Ala carboxypeptidase family metallohydrolase [Paracoccus alcaliphilus]SEO15865.1 Peptidase M15 [Paracoccus alcaliphilus]
MTYYQHWRNVPAKEWHWPNFSPAEIACRGTGKIQINEDALDRLQELRVMLGKPLIVNSAYRSPEHNKRVGGAKASQHLNGCAFDISMANHDPVTYIAAARKAGFKGIGTYPRSNFVHIDTGPARSWGDPFSARPSRFAADAAPAREHLADSRTIKGGGAAGIGTVGAAGVEVVQSALAEAQGAVQPLIGHLDTLRWVFVALALGGIAVTIYARLDDWKRGRR